VLKWLLPHQGKPFLLRKRLKDVLKRRKPVKTLKRRPLKLVAWIMI